MTNILFVHGTGTSRNDSDRGLARIHDATIKRGISAEAKGLFWGELREHLSERDLASVPSASNEINERRAKSSLWNLLTADPLVEIRVVCSHPKATWRGGDVDWFARTRGLQFTNSVFAEPWVPSQFIESLERASQWLLETPQFATAVKNVKDNAGFSQIIARALIARTTAVGGAERSELFRDAHQVFVEAVARELWQEYGGPLANAIYQTISQLGTEILRHDRHLLRFSISRIIGDILAYQAHAEGPARLLEKELNSMGQDVTIIAHSLGGIIVFDYLVRQGTKQVKQFISVGTQVGLFYELGALRSMPDLTSISDFPRWLNIYDQNDFLSYLAAGVLPTLCARDAPVDNGLPFPDSHSGYWSNAEVWDEIEAFLNVGSENAV